MTPQAARALVDAKAKPLGALGRLEELAIRLAVAQDTVRPLVEAAVLVCAGDHGSAPYTSAFPSAVTAAMVGQFLAGRAAIALFARQVGARLLVLDAGVALGLPAHPGLLDAKAGAGTADFLTGPAMTAAARDGMLARMRTVVGDLHASGTTVLALGEMGIGNTASAALLAHKVAGLPLLVGSGAGLDAAGLGRKQAAVARAAARTPARLAPELALLEYGGYEVVALVGAILAARGTPMLVLVDGVIVTAAALLAHAIDPEATVNCVFAHRSAEPGHDAMLRHMGASPLLDLGLRLGEGSGAALAIPLLRAAASIFEMADLSDVA